MLHRGLLGLSLLVVVGCGDGTKPRAPGVTGRGDPRAELSMREQIAAIEAGTYSGAELAQLYLERITAIDGTLHAVIATAPDALVQARALDARRGSGARLQGAVILVKDNIDTRGLATTAGSLALANNIAAADAFVVARLRAANALILGKTNLSEWANFRSTSSISGWSSLGGQTVNGRQSNKNPCGSSSGSAVAVAAGLASATLGSETDGSIICPAAMNGVVGFKPTVGLVSRSLVIPIAASQDTLGPITRTVGDAARLLGVIAGVDRDDPATLAIPVPFSLDFEAPLATATLRGKRLGVVDFGYDASIMALFARERARLEAAGATVIDVPFHMGSTWSDDELLVLEYELKDGLDRYLASHPVDGQPASLEQLIAYNTANAAKVMPYFGQELLVSSQSRGDLTSPAYRAARQRNIDAFRTNGIDAVMASHDLDALIAPSASPPWPLATTADPPATVIASSPSAIAGYPHLTVPMGTLGNAPIGLSIFGRAWDDAKILALGYAYEQLPRR